MGFAGELGASEKRSWVRGLEAGGAVAGEDGPTFTARKTHKELCQKTTALVLFMAEGRRTC